MMLPELRDLLRAYADDRVADAEFHARLTDALRRLAQGRARPAGVRYAIEEMTELKLLVLGET
jgi:hypothetical protein